MPSPPESASFMFPLQKKTPYNTGKLYGMQFQQGEERVREAKHTCLSSCGLHFLPPPPVPELCIFIEYLLQFIGLCLILIPVCILPVGQPQTPHSQDAVHIIPDPGIFLIIAGWKQASHWIL